MLAGKVAIVTGGGGGIGMKVVESEAELERFRKVVGRNLAEAQREGKPK